MERSLLSQRYLEIAAYLCFEIVSLCSPGWPHTHGPRWDLRLQAGATPVVPVAEGIATVQQQNCLH